MFYPKTKVGMFSLGETTIVLSLKDDLRIVSPLLYSPQVIDGYTKGTREELSLKDEHSAVSLFGNQGKRSCDCSIKERRGRCLP